jgi:serine protease Do
VVRDGSSSELRAADYAGLLERLLTFEGAAARLDTDLGAVKADGDLGTKLATARTSLSSAASFVRTQAEAVDKHARQIAPLAKEVQAAWASLKTSCEPKRSPAECSGVRDAAAKFDAAETSAQHDRAVLDLTGLRLTTPAVVRARDRAVAAEKAIQGAMKARADVSAPIPRRWSALLKDLATSVGDVAAACKGASGGERPPAADGLVAAERPEPRKLTVLVHVKPPAGVERSLQTLARSASDDDERSFYEARAEGAFGSGFFIVRKPEAGPKQGTPDLLVITNRHVVELGDRATLELADGTSLGPADVVYSSPTYDLAVLRPVQKLSVTEGFAFARAPAKDQQTVIATGFPGMVGRPSYQTTRGYVSNESFRLDDGTRPLAYVQHTAPIDPGSSGGPLTDESGRVLGVNTMKVMGREAVGLAVPSTYVLDTLRTTADVELHVGSRPHRQRASRLACLSFVAELGAMEPRPLVLEQMVSNRLVGAEGLDAAVALASDEEFEQLWNADSVRAMRIAVLVRLRNAALAGGGPSVLETCSELSTQRGSDGAGDVVEYKVRLANFESRSLTLRWEQGRYKVDGLEGRAPAAKGPRKLPPPGPPSSAPPGKRVSPPGKRP